MHTLLADLRYALRQLRRSPGFALTAILTMALGVAANVTVFGIIDALLLKPLPVAHPEQLSFLQHRNDGDITLSFPQYLDLRQRNRTFTDLAAYRTLPIGLEAGGKTQPRWAYVATGSYFDTLGIQPMLGRFFRDADDRRGPNASPWMVLSYATWKQDFAADPDIVGRTVRISQQPFTVLGVAGPDFTGTERFMRPAIWVDMWNESQFEGFNYLNARGNSGIWVMGRRKPGVTVVQAQADLDRIAHQFAHEYPQTDDRIGFRLAPLGFLGAFLGTPARSFLAGLMFLAALVLVAACVNLGGLYAARAADRTRELAIRVALGAGRGRVLSQLLLLSTVLAAAGGLLGSLLARLALQGISQFRPPFDFPLAVAVNPSISVYFFAILLSLAAGLVSGLPSVRETSRTDLVQTIRASASTPAFGRRWSLRDLLLLLEVVLCCVLVNASFVSLRGLERSLHAPLGFQPERVIIASFNLNLAHYTDQQALPVQRKVLEQVEHLPGVTHAAFANDFPLNMVGQNSTAVYPSGTTDFRPGNRAFGVQYFAVSPQYFATAQTPLLSGRDFTWADDAHAPRVAIVNQTFARKLFGSEVAALGRSFIDGSREPLQIIGITQDGKYSSLNEDPAPALFRAAAQSPDTYTQLLVQTRQPASLALPQIAPGVTAAVAAADPSVPISSLAPWTQDLAPVLFPSRAATLALGVLGILAMSLAVTGIFGLASYTVTRRMRDFGIRIALGASRQSVLRSAFSRVATTVVLGSAAGILLGLAFTRVLAAIVYGASTSDPLVLVSASLTMLLLGLFSAALPARRALRIDPATLLREE